VSLLLRRILLSATALIGAYVGGWAAVDPRSFYDSFPGLGLIWISIDGPWNEHLVRDVGTLYLGLAAATAFAAVQRTEASAVVASRVIGTAWVVFSVPHLGYHALHLDGLGPVDVVMQMVSLSSTVVLGALLLLGPERGRARRTGTGAAATDDLAASG
jgi:hypothetical protein